MISIYSSHSSTNSVSSRFSRSPRSSISGDRVDPQIQVAQEGDLETRPRSGYHSDEPEGTARSTAPVERETADAMPEPISTPVPQHSVLATVVPGSKTSLRVIND